MTERERHADLVIIGGGLGGVAAALTAVDLGLTAVLTEEHGLLGGQLSSQAVPPDEHPWVESTLTSPSYRRLRTAVRDYYRRTYPLRPEALTDPLLNPGLGYVSRLCAEPVVYASVIDELIAPAQASGRLRVLRRHVPVGANTEGDEVTSVTVRDLRTGAEVVLTAPMFIDATETGELLPLAGVEYVVGAEARSQTGELHASEVADPLDQQAITWCFAVDLHPGEDHTIDRPAGYDHWATHADAFWAGPQLSWTDIEPKSLRPRVRPLFAGDPDAARLEDLWHYRRLLARRQFVPGFLASDITIVNWPQNDYWAAPIVDVPDADRRDALAGARELSLSLLYWMQTAAPRHDGGVGYPGLRPRGDLLGSDDQLALAPYIRESRRIRARFTVTEAHLGREMRGQDAGSEVFADSVGIGYYRIDLHPSPAGRSYVDIPSFPFQIPLGALLPERVRNLLPAGKNIGTTHITNGCYRLHPVEWSIGEVAGALAAFAAAAGVEPAAVREPPLLAEFQSLLGGRLGITLAWPDEIRTGATEQDEVPMLGLDPLDPKLRQPA